jgi:hypothetical protein
MSKPVQVEALDLRVGRTVRCSDKANFGTIIEVKGTEFLVLFRNPDNGNTAEVLFPADMLTPIR